MLGPGLGQDAATRELVRRFVRECPVPLVIDADGLNALAALGERGPRAPAWTRTARDDPHAAPGRDGAARRARHAEVQRDRPAAGAGARARDGRDRRAEGRAHAGGRAGRARGRLADRQPRDGDRRHGRRAGRRGRIAAGAARGAARRDRGALRARPRGRPRGARSAARRGSPPATWSRRCPRRSRTSEPAARARAGQEVAHPRARDAAARTRRRRWPRRSPPVSAAARWCCSRGELGAGKTAFVRGLARGLGADPDEVVEPDVRAADGVPGPADAAPRRPLPAARATATSASSGSRSCPGRGACWRSSGPSGCASAPWPSALRVSLVHAGEDRRSDPHRGGGVRRALLAARGARRSAAARGQARGRTSRARRRAAPRAGNRLNVLLITIDTLRADHLGAYGYAARDEPEDRRARPPRRALRAGLHLLAEDARQLRRAPDRAARGAERLRQVAPAAARLQPHARERAAGRRLRHGRRGRQPERRRLARLREGLRALPRDLGGEGARERDGPRARDHAGRGRVPGRGRSRHARSCSGCTT